MRQLQQDLQLSMREADGLRVSLEEQQLSAGETEQQLRLWAQQLGAECQLLRHLVEPGGATQGSEPSPPRYSYYYFNTFFHPSIHFLYPPLPALRVGGEQRSYLYIFYIVCVCACMCVIVCVFVCLSVYLPVCLWVCMCCTQFVEPWDRLHCLTLMKISLIDYQ